MTDNALLESAGIILVSSFSTRMPSLAFSGMAFTDDAIIIGEEGYRQYRATKKPHGDIREGRFSLFATDEDGGATAYTDGMGQDIIFYYASDLGWAFSNSFLALAEHLRDQGMPLTPRRSAMVFGRIELSAMEQLVSHRTFIDQINILPRYKKLRMHGKRLWMEDRKDFRKTASSYEDGLILYASRWASRLSSLVRRFGANTEIDISGGVDSRAVLALLLAGQERLDGLHFISNTKRKEDFDTATALSREFHFTIDNRRAVLPVAPPDTAYKLWGYGNLGVYLPVYWPIGDRPANGFHVFGGGGECFRRVSYYYMSPKAYVRRVTRPMPGREFKRLARRELEEAFAEMDLNRKDPLSMMEYYQSFRSRFHFGRGWYRHLSGTMISPLASCELDYAYGPPAEQKQRLERNQIFCDLMLLVDRKLIEMPFDKPGKAFRPSVIADSPFAQRRPNLKPLLTDVEIYASSQAPVAGESRSNIHMKRRLEQELCDNIEPARSLGIHSPEFIAQAKEKIQTGSRFTVDARQASHIIATGKVAQLTSA